MSPEMNLGINPGAVSGMARGHGGRAVAGRVLMLALALALLSSCGIFRSHNKRGTDTIGERISVLGFEQQTVAAPELKNIAIVLPSAQINADWNQPAGDASGSMGNVALAAAPVRRWTVDIGAGSNKTKKLNATPVVAQNRLFVMDADARVSAFDATTGRPLWQQEITRKGEDQRPAFGGGVSVLGGRVVASTGFGSVVAFDAATGKQLWRAEVSTPLRGAPGVSDDRVFVLSDDSRLVALSADDGTDLWEANATVEPATVMGPGGPAIALGTVVAGFPSGELFALRVENGRTLWQDQLSQTGRTTALGALSGIVGAPVIDRDRVFAISHGGRMVAIDIASGQRIWERDLAGVNTPWPAGDWVFTVTLDGELLALSRADGRIRWVTDLGAWKNMKKKKGPIEWFGPVLAGGQLILSSSQGQLVFVDPVDGRIAARQKLEGAAHLPPIVANGMLYMLTDDGKLAAYR